jgi:hypothetical protein
MLYRVSERYTLDKNGYAANTKKPMIHGLTNA